MSSPTNAETVKAVMRGIRRTIGAARVQKAPATADRLAAMLALIPPDTATGKRDRTLLLCSVGASWWRWRLPT